MLYAMRSLVGTRNPRRRCLAAMREHITTLAGQDRRGARAQVRQQSGCSAAWTCEIQKSNIDAMDGDPADVLVALLLELLQ